MLESVQQTSPLWFCPTLTLLLPITYSLSLSLPSYKMGTRSTCVHFLSLK